MKNGWYFHHFHPSIFQSRWLFRYQEPLGGKSGRWNVPQFWVKPCIVVCSKLLGKDKTTNLVQLRNCWFRWAFDQKTTKKQRNSLQFSNTEMLFHILHIQFLFENKCWTFQFKATTDSYCRETEWGWAGVPSSSHTLSYGILQVPPKGIARKCGLIRGFLGDNDGWHVHKLALFPGYFHQPSGGFDWALKSVRFLLTTWCFKANHLS